jgi:hypothetical protein
MNDVLMIQTRNQVTRPGDSSQWHAAAGREALAERCSSRSHSLSTGVRIGSCAHSPAWSARLIPTAAMKVVDAYQDAHFPRSSRLRRTPKGANEFR